MLCYRALGNEAAERRETALYTRFKADESSQAITGSYRRLNREDNLERQPIHEHANRYAPPARAGGTTSCWPCSMTPAPASRSSST